MKRSTLLVLLATSLSGCHWPPPAHRRPIPVHLIEPIIIERRMVRPGVQPTTVQVAAFPPTPAPTPVGDFLVTCYALPGHTATGTSTHVGSIAVDPAIVPLGTRLYVDGYGYGVAQDTGSSIHGRRLDVWLPTAGECAAWGRRDVWVHSA